MIQEYKEMRDASEPFTTIRFEDDELVLIDQRILPTEVSYVRCTDYTQVEFAIRDMIVRGAPAIGATAAYGYYLAALEFAELEEPEFEQKMREAFELLDASRPTAVNLRWALERMDSVRRTNTPEGREAVLTALKREADTITAEDIEINRAIGRHGSEVIASKATILTHCNTGALATAGWGTALGVIKQAYEDGKEIFVYADETRPRLQGARLTAWELVQSGIPSCLIPDSAAATLIRDGKIDCVILGGDRVAANGDVCNKIGTFMLSVICKMYGVPFYSVVPISTIDFAIASGKEIPIENRDASEVNTIAGTLIAPEEMAVYNPAFDVTPHQNITGIITEVGIIRPPFKENIERIRKSHVERT